MFKYGNPIILDGAGRIKTDALNEERIELVLSRFEEWARSKGQLEKFKYSISKSENERSLIAFPAAGFAVASILLSLELSLLWPLCTLTASILASFSRFLPLGWATRCTNNTVKVITFREGSAISGTTPLKSAK